MIILCFWFWWILVFLMLRDSLSVKCVVKSFGVRFIWGNIDKFIMILDRLYVMIILYDLKFCILVIWMSCLIRICCVVMLFCYRMFLRVCRWELLICMCVSIVRVCLVVFLGWFVILINVIFLRIVRLFYFKCFLFFFVICRLGLCGVLIYCLCLIVRKCIYFWWWFFELNVYV